MLEVQREAKTLQQRAEAAEERVLELQREAAPGVPALMRAAEGVGAVVAGMELRALRALDGAWAAAAETIRAERAERARRMPKRFLCPISHVLSPASFDPRVDASFNAHCPSSLVRFLLHRPIRRRRLCCCDPRGQG